MPKCRNCGSNMLKGYLRLDEETTAKISVCPRSDNLHLELQESDLLFYCVRKNSRTSRKGKLGK